MLDYGQNYHQLYLNQAINIASFASKRLLIFSDAVEPDACKTRETGLGKFLRLTQRLSARISNGFDRLHHMLDSGQNYYQLYLYPAINLPCFASKRQLLFSDAVQPDACENSRRETGPRKSLRLRIVFQRGFQTGFDRLHHMLDTGYNHHQIYLHRAIIILSFASKRQLLFPDAVEPDAYENSRNRAAEISKAYVASFSEDFKRGLIVSIICSILGIIITYFIYIRQ
jgi:hypothetical protein